MTASPTTDLVKDGRCRHCGNKLGLLQRLSKGEFCSPEHRNAYLREQERLALECLQQSPDLPDTELEPSPAAPLDEPDLLSAPPEELLKAVFAGSPAQSQSESPEPAPEAVPEPAPVPDSEPAAQPVRTLDPPEGGFLPFGYCLGEHAPAGAVDEPEIRLEHRLPGLIVSTRPTNLVEASPHRESRPLFPSLKLPPSVEAETVAEEDPFAAAAGAIAKAAFDCPMPIDWDQLLKSERLREQRERGPEQAGVTSLPPPSFMPLEAELKSQALAITPWASELRLPAAWGSTSRTVSTQLPPRFESLSALPALSAIQPVGSFRRSEATARGTTPLVCLPPQPAGIANAPAERHTSAAELCELVALSMPGSRINPGSIQDVSSGPGDSRSELCLPPAVPGRPAVTCLRMAPKYEGDSRFVTSRNLPPALQFDIPSPEPSFSPVSMLESGVGQRVAGPPRPRKRMRASLPMRDSGANPLLDPFTCPFGGQEDAWQPEL
jgi:hypothetical protein